MAYRHATQFPVLGNPKILEKFNPDVKKILEVWRGDVGDGWDKVITLRDLSDVGILTTRTVSGVTTLSGTAPGVVPGSGSSGTVGALVTPNAPTGLTASGSLGGVNVEWDASSESYYAYTEILRAGVDNAGLATVVGKSIHNVHRDELWSSGTFYYWIRFVNSDGVTVKTGPLNAAAGTVATVGEDPAFTLSVLASQITETELFSTLNTRLDNIEPLTTEKTIKVDVNGHIAGFGVAVSGGVGGPITSDIIMLADRFSIGLPAYEWSAAYTVALGDYAKATTSAPGIIFKATDIGSSPNQTGGTEPTWPTLGNTVVDGDIEWTGVSITETIPFVVGVVGGSPAVVIDTVIIGDATIGNAKIGDLAADKITTADLTATLTINGGAIYGGIIGTSSGSGFRSLISEVDSYPLWVGTGTKNDANAVFYVKNDGSAKYAGPVTFTSGSSGYANISDRPTELADINGTEGTKLTGIATGADVTSANTAAAINGQGTLATLSSADWSIQIGGVGKPDDDADVTSANTAADTSAVNGLAAASVSGWAHGSDTTKIDGGDIFTNTVTASAIAALTITAAEIAALTITAAEIAANTITAGKINVTELSAISADLGNVTAGTIQSSAYITTGSFLSVAASGSDTTLNLVDTSDFSSSGSGQIVGSTNDRDAISWTGKTSTTLTGCSGVLANPIHSIVVPDNVKTIFFSDQANELRMFGDRGDGTEEELISLGITSSGSDSIIGDFGSLNSSRIAIRALSDNDTTIYAQNNIAAGSLNDYTIRGWMAGDGVAVAGESDGDGVGVIGSCNGTGYGVKALITDSGLAPLLIAANTGIPSHTAQKGSIWVRSQFGLIYINVDSSTTWDRIGTQ